MVFLLAMSLVIEWKSTSRGSRCACTAPARSTNMAVTPVCGISTTSRMKLDEVEPRAEDADHLAAFDHDAVDPHLGDLQHIVLVDIEVAAFTERGGAVVPAIARVGGVELVAQLLAGIAVGGVVEIVVARGADDEEVGMVGEGLAVVLELGDAARLALGIGLVAGPLADGVRARQGLGELDLLHQRAQAAIAVEQDLLFGEQRAELHHRGIDDGGKAEIGGDGD